MKKMKVIIYLIFSIFVEYEEEGEEYYEESDDEYETRKYINNEGSIEIDNNKNLLSVDNFNSNNNEYDSLKPQEESSYKGKINKYIIT